MSVATPTRTRRIRSADAGGEPPQRPIPLPGGDDDNHGHGKVPYVLVILCAVLVAIVIAVVATLSGSDKKSSPQAIAPSQIPGANTPSGTPAEQQAVSQWMHKHHWNDGQYSFTINRPVSVERGASAMSAKPVVTLGELRGFIKGNGPRSVAYRRAVKAAVPAADYQRILAGTGFVRVQLLVPATYLAGSYLSGNNVFYTNAPRSTQAGDVLWVYTTASHHTKVLGDGTTVKNTSYGVKSAGNTRAGCGNLNEVPVPSSSAPPAPNVSVPVPQSQIKTTPTPPGGHNAKPPLSSRTSDQNHYPQASRTPAERQFGSTVGAPPHRFVNPSSPEGRQINNNGDSRHVGTFVPPSGGSAPVTNGETGRPAPSGNPGPQGSDGASGSNPTPPSSPPDSQGAAPGSSSPPPAP